MARCCRLIASFAESDVRHAALSRKVGQLPATHGGDGLLYVYFKSPLTLAALQTKTAVMKKNLSLQTARAQELTEEDWAQPRASATQQEEPSSSSQVSVGTVSP